ncbi:MAG TPA: amino acid racemase [Thermoanaerobaculia bacterium]|nr:amino acid racemase [Thermoanaerobaculia bacterium]
MKSVGIIGGIAPESTIEYYRLMIAAYRKLRPDAGYPSIVINSIDLTKILGLVAAQRLAELTDYVAGEIQRLADAGVDFALLASNTPHIVFDELRRGAPIPLLSIVEAACERAVSTGMKSLGLFGTRFTMQGRFYPEVFSRAGIELFLPQDAEQTYIHDRYMGELVNAVFLPATRDGLLSIAERMVARYGIEGVILGGTDLPLILRDASASVPFLDTTAIHVEKAVAEMLR